MRNFLNLITPFFYGDQKSYARWYGLYLLLLSQATTSFGYFFIQWNRRFYDALETKNSDRFFHEMLVFSYITIAFVLVSSLYRYSGQQYALRWRVWMTKSALRTWLKDVDRGRVEGADQRIQEDLMRFTTIFERFFLDCFNSVILIIVFIPMLFSLTHQHSLGGFNLAWVLTGAVIVYTVFGMLISAKIANPLIKVEYDNQKLEAQFRYNLVHVKDGADMPLSFFEGLLGSIVNNYHTNFTRQKYFNIWQKAYDQFSFIFPYALLASNYFSGALTLGMLMQIRSTFSRIRNSMAYLLDHYTEFTEMLAISKRLVEFYDIAEIEFITAMPQIKNQPVLD